MIYVKRAITVEEQIKQLKQRGLIIENESIASKYLLEVGYYRLAGYWWSMQTDKVNHIFKPKSSFKDVVALYNFDSELRILLFSALERIEVSLRTKLIYYLSHEFDPWWFQNELLFRNKESFNTTLKKISIELKRSQDAFIKEHLKKYQEDKRYPPSWKSLELASFGTLSKLYGNLKHDIESKEVIAQLYGAVNHTYLPSWLQSLSQIRNYCAHHSRLWNKNIPSTVKLLKKAPYPWINEVPNRDEFSKLYIHLCIIRYLLNRIDPTNSFHLDLKGLMAKYPSVDPNALGFKVNWMFEPLWLR